MTQCIVLRNYKWQNYKIQLERDNHGTRVTTVLTAITMYNSTSLIQTWHNGQDDVLTAKQSIQQLKWKRRLPQKSSFQLTYLAVRVLKAITPTLTMVSLFCNRRKNFWGSDQQQKVLINIFSDYIGRKNASAHAFEGSVPSLKLQLGLKNSGLIMTTFSNMEFTFWTAVLMQVSRRTETGMNVTWGCTFCTGYLYVEVYLSAPVPASKSFYEDFKSSCNMGCRQYL